MSLLGAIWLPSFRKCPNAQLERLGIRLLQAGVPASRAPLIARFTLSFFFSRKPIFKIYPHSCLFLHISDFKRCVHFFYADRVERRVKSHAEEDIAEPRRFSPDLSAQSWPHAASNGLNAHPAWRLLQVINLLTVRHPFDQNQRQRPEGL